ncbi:LVIVD repeat-containing protein [Halomarina rubra]|uniref:LVIVD repeat-containing protein n=1 Tax=Halomarina rubra TaxID=2071873 RepID=A0ABD6AYE7_9EURY|nr:hypothetical protein [Halomarina rubra]
MRRRALLTAVGSLAAVGTAGGAVSGRVAARSQGDAFGPTGTLAIPGTQDTAVADDGETVFVATGDGFAVADVSDLASPELLAERRSIRADHEDGPLSGIWDVECSGSNVLVAGPAGPSQTDLQGAALFDVSTPDDPELVSFYEADHGVHNVALDGTTAYLTGSGRHDEPVVVVEMDDGGEAKKVTDWSPVDAADRLSMLDSNLRNCHDLTVDGERLYASYWETGTWVLDVSDPATPSTIARIGGRPLEELRNLPRSETRRALLNPPGNAHNAALNDDGLLAVSHEAFGEGVEGMGGVTLWDVSDLESGLVEGEEAVPTLDTARRRAILAPSAPDAESGKTLTTAHNCAFRGDRLYTSWYLDGVRAYDVADPASPGLLAGWADPSEANFFDAVPVAGGFVAPNLGVAEERGEPPQNAGLYTFTDPPADADTSPAATRTPVAVDASVTTTAPTTEETPATSTSVSTQAGTDTPRPSTAAATSNTTATTATDGTTGGSGPGFGAFTALAGGALATWRLLGGERSEE